MNNSSFRCPEAGSIYRSMAGDDTFVPAKLPPAIAYDRELSLALSRADAALSELSGVGRLLPNPHLLIASYMRQEAILSSRIEGTRTALSELLLDDVGAVDSTAAEEADRREVRNYIQAMEQGIEFLNQGHPLTLNMVRALHDTLMRNVRGGKSSPGQFRTMQNWIDGATAKTAVYVPPPPELLLTCLSDWERFINTSGEMPDLIQCALLHEQFEAIHPFIDGNGRIGRLLIPLFLMERGRLSLPLLNLSSFIEPQRSTYYNLLQRVRTDCDWTAWIHFFLTGVEHTARQAVHQTKQLVDLREDFRSRVQDNAKALALVDVLLGNPYITVKRAKEVLSVSAPTARSAIAVLMNSGILAIVPGRTKPALHVSAPIYDILANLDAPPARDINSPSVNFGP